MPITHTFDFNDDKTEAEVYDTDGTYLGHLDLPDGKTAEDYQDADGEYWFDGEGDFTPYDPDAVDGEGDPGPSSEDPAATEEGDPGGAAGEGSPTEEPPAPEDSGAGNQDAIDAAQDAVDAAEDAVGNAEDAVGNAEDAVGEAEDAVGEAEDGLGEAEEALEGAEENQDDAEGELEEAEGERDDKQDQLDDAQGVGTDAGAGLDGLDGALGDADAAADTAAGLGEGIEGDGIGGAGSGAGAGVEDLPGNGQTAGDPVSLYSGAQRVDHVDLAIVSVGPGLGVTRSYSSHLHRAGSFGPGWDTWWDAEVRLLGTGAAYVSLGCARGAFFGPPEDAVNFVPPAGEPARLAVDGAGWVLRSGDERTWSFSADGRLRSVADAWGNALTVARNGAGRPTSITDALGRDVTLATDVAGRVTEVADWTGRKWRYGYDGAGRLVTVTSPVGPAWTFGYSTATSDPRTRSLLTTIADGTGTVVVRSTYGTSGDDLHRVVTQTFAGDTWTFAYEVVDASATGAATVARRTVVDDPEGVTTTYDFNPDGALLADSVTDGGTTWTTEREVDDDGNVTATTFPRGNRVEVDWSWVGPAGGQRPKPSKVASVPAGGGTGPVTSSTYDAAGRVVEVTDPLGGEVAFTRDANGAVTAVRAPMVTRPDGSSARPTSTYVLDAEGRITRRVDPVGIVEERTYHGSGSGEGLLATVAVDGVVRWSYEWDELSRPASVTDAAGAIVSFTYDDLDRLVAVDGEAGSGRRLTYDAAGNCSTVERHLLGASGAAGPVEWVATRTSSDERGRPVRISEQMAAGTWAVSELAWTSNDRLAEVVAPGGCRTTYTYDVRGLLVERVVDAGGARPGVEEWVHDNNGNVVSYVDPLGHVHTWTVDGLDRPTRHELPTGTTVDVTWDLGGRVTAEVGREADGTLRWQDAYLPDAVGRLVSIGRRLVEPDGTARAWLRTTIEHDLAGRATAVVAPDGGRTTTTWDGFDGLVEVVDAGGSAVSYDRRDDGLAVATTRTLVSSVDATDVRSITHAFTYDELGRPASVTDPLGNLEAYEHDTLGRLTRLVRADGLADERVFDLAGRLTDRSLPWQAVDGTDLGTIELAYGHDGDGNVVSVDGPTGRVVTLTVDARGAVTAVRRGDGSLLRTIELDVADNPVRTVDGVGSEVLVGYDGEMRPVSRSITHGAGAEGITAETYAYDALGGLTSATNDDHTLTATWDSFGRPWSVDVDGTTVSRTYVASSGALREVTLPGGARLTYEHDNLGRLTKVSATDGTTSRRTVATLTWLGAGHLLAVDHAGGGRTSSIFDLAGRLLRRSTLDAAGDVVEDVIEVRDALGRTQRRVRAGLGTVALDHDSTGAVTAEVLGDPVAAPNVADWSLVDGGGATGTQAGLDALAAGLAGVATATVDYVYDGAGNRLARGGEVYVTDSLDRLVSVDGTAVTTDAGGNVSGHDGRTFVHDHDGRLVAVRDAAGASLLACTYDPLGRLVTITDSGGTTTLVSDLLSLVGELDGASSMARLWVPGPTLDHSLAVVVSGTVRHLHRDGVGTLLAASSSTGAEHWDIDAFGRTRGTYDDGWTAASVDAVATRLHGLRDLGDLDLVHVRQRTYSAAWGRFLEVDPLLAAGDANLYRFAGNDPMLFVDPLGDIVWVPIIAGALIGAGIAAYLNWDKSGMDFAVAVGAGMAGGALAGTGLGVASFALGGAVSGGMVGGYEGYKLGGAEGAVTGGVVGGVLGGVAGGLGGAAGAKLGTAVTGALNSSLRAGALSGLGAALGGRGSWALASYGGVALGGLADGSISGGVGGFGHATGQALAGGADVGDALASGASAGLDGARSGAIAGPLAAVGSKGAMQGAWGLSRNGNYNWSHALGAEGEFMVMNQTTQPKATFETPKGKLPDMWGDPRIGNKPVYGDVKNTATIPSLNKQNGQLKDVLANVPDGHPMTIFHRPGAPIPGPKSGVGKLVASGDIDLQAITQFAFVPPTSQSLPS